MKEEKTAVRSKKRDAVLAAALKLAVEHGFHGTSTAAIAEEAEVGMGTIYRHFENKEGLFTTLFYELRDKFMHIIVSNYDMQSDLQSNFRNIVYVLVHYYVEHDDEFRFLERYSDHKQNFNKRLDESIKLVDPVRNIMSSMDHGFNFKELPPLVLFAMTYGPLVAVINLVLMGRIELTDDIIYKIADSTWESILKREV